MCNAPTRKDIVDAPSTLQSTSNGQSASFEALLWHRLTSHDESSITVEGVVLSKRSLGKGLVFADFYVAAYQDTCQVMLRAETFEQDFSAARRLLLKGTKVRLTGKASATRIPGNVVLMMESLEFRGFPKDLQYIQMLIQQYQDGLIPTSNILEALPPDVAAIEHRLIASTASPDSKHLRKELAQVIFESLSKNIDFAEAVDQVPLPIKKNFVVPPAPPEWQHVPVTLRIQPNKSSLFSSVAGDETGQVDQSSITISGWVQNRRRFDGNITMLALVDEFSPTCVTQNSGNDLSDTGASDVSRLVAILHPDLISSHTAGLYRNLAAVGSKVRLSGRLVQEVLSLPSSEREGDRRSGTLWVSSICLQQSSSRSVTVRHLLDLVHDGVVELDEASRAMLITRPEEARGLLSMDATQRQWKANEIAVRLQDAVSSSSSDKNSESSNNFGILEKYRCFTERHSIEETSLEAMGGLLAALTTIDIPQRDKQPARAVLPLGMPGSTWQRKKRPQLAWMGEQIRQVLESHPDYGKRKLQILDIGGGKGSLAQYLGQSFREEVQIQVVDICEGAVANGARKAQRLNLPVDFSLADASQALNLTTVDVVVALHACGHLSDVALAHAVQRKAGFVIVPCCFNSNPHLSIPTDSNQQVSVPTWLDIPNSDWSMLKLLAEVQGDVTRANEAIATICAVRADAACRYLSSDVHSVEGDRTVSYVTIKRFPIEFSTRNTVIVGKCR